MAVAVAGFAVYVVERAWPYLLAGVVLSVFAIGFTAMAAQIRRTGGFFVYIGHVPNTDYLRGFVDLGRGHLEVLNVAGLRDLAASQTGTGCSVT